MNNSTFQDWYSIIGIVSACTFLLPIIAIILKKLLANKSLYAFIGFGLITFVYHLLILGVLNSTPRFFTNFELLYEFVLNPLLLITLFYFVDSAQLASALKKALVSFTGFQIAVLAIMGINEKSKILILGLGLLLTLTFTLIVFFPQIRRAVGERVEMGKGFVISALLFASCCYTVLYTLMFVAKTKHLDDLFALYNLSSLISNLIITIGFLLARKSALTIQKNQDPRETLNKIKFPDWDELPMNN
jgi:hypothetical protein